MFNLSEEELTRYSRQLILDEVGGKGQSRLKKAKILIVGTGGLGSPAAFYLAAAGIGTLGLIDDDKVELSNLQRQILHSTDDLGEPKPCSAGRTLSALNPNIEIITYNKRLNKDNVEDLIKDYDLIVNGVDNFPSRYLLNDACVINNKPFIEAGILRYSGQLTTIIPGEGPCYRCVFPSPPEEGTIPSCQEAGVLGVTAGTIGTLQAVEAVKFILGAGKLLTGRMLIFDALEMNFREVEIKKSEDCPVCGQNPTITTLEEYELHCDI